MKTKISHNPNPPASAPPGQSSNPWNSRPVRRLCGLAIAAIGLSASFTSAYADYVAATGGTVTTHREAANVVTVHTFTSGGTFTVTTGGTVNYLVVGGGGGGGGSTGGGGGAGGFLAGTTSVTGTAYTITVGAGGAGGAGNGNPGGFGTNGDNSVFGSFATAIGGGGGAPNGDSGSANGKAGGSGGGGSYVNSPSVGGAATAGQGNAGGACLDWGGPYTPGGGGGAGAVGTDGNTQGSGADGGAGLSSTISDGVTSIWYAGGGGSGNFNGDGGFGGLGGGGNGASRPSPTSGVANTGGGGGGQCQNSGDTAGSGGAGIVIISYISGVSSAPYSTNASLTVLENTATALTSGNFDYWDPNSGPLAAVQITTLPALGTLKLSGTPVTLNQIVSAANVPNLTYKSALPTFGTGDAYTTIGFKLENSNTLWSDAAVMTVNVTPAIIVQNPSFETIGQSLGGPWATAADVWNANLTYAQSNDNGRFATRTDSGIWYANLTDPGDVFYQNLGASVNSGDTLSVTFHVGRENGQVGGVMAATFLVDGTPYTETFDTTGLTEGTWQSYTLTKTIANSGPLTLQFSNVSDRPWLDNISNISVTSGSGPTPGSYAAWALANAPGQNPSQDSNNDGVPNGVAYFMGSTGLATLPVLDPATSTIGWPMSSTYSGSYQVQTSADLSIWTAVSPQPTRDSGTGLLSYTLPTGLGTQFVRLVVTPN